MEITKKMPFWKLKENAKWGKLYKTFDNESIKLDSEIKKNYFRFLVLYYNYISSNILIESYYESFGENSIESKRGQNFIGVDVLKNIKLDTLKMLYDFVEENNLTKEFKIDGNLLKKERRDLSNIDSSNIRRGLV